MVNVDSRALDGEDLARFLLPASTYFLGEKKKSLRIVRVYGKGKLAAVEDLRSLDAIQSKHDHFGLLGPEIKDKTLLHNLFCHLIEIIIIFIQAIK